MNYIGIDNGIGTIGMVFDWFMEDGAEMYHLPQRKELNYTKTKQWITIINFEDLATMLSRFCCTNTIVALERPMVNPTRFKQSIVAAQNYRVVMLALQQSKLPFRVVDSKQWQKEVLPSGLKGIELKKASLEVGKRLFPYIDFSGFKDADGLLIAEWLKREEKK